MLTVTAPEFSLKKGIEVNVFIELMFSTAPQQIGPVCWVLIWINAVLPVTEKLLENAFFHTKLLTKLIFR